MTQLLALLISWAIEIHVVLIILAKIQPFPRRDVYYTSVVAFAATLFTYPLAWESSQILIIYSVDFPYRKQLLSKYYNK
ncbi:hypothetical protein [Calothrix sp. PCC 6303]|uniref:hypothetical protein n=1 Tax=Calothrix sp. PCC 6303 TaxID=1170562 RepID=UPI0002A038FE|nr:hypothetical protein [Calothrix sp. PCC 6303]AFZ03973.1 hypothetical protein Cal6303_5084 [Calothrix sp. PCC 6303]